MITQKDSNVYIQCERHLCHLFSIYKHEGAYIYSLLYLSEGTEFVKNCRIKNKLKAWMPKWWNKQCCKLLRTAVEVVTKTDSRTSRILLSAFPPFLLFCLLLWNGITVQQRLILWPLCVIKVLPLLVIIMFLLSSPKFENHKLMEKPIWNCVLVDRWGTVVKEV